MTTETNWFTKAVFYEVLVRTFADSNGDGVGDMQGLTSKLDYLQWLGVDCLWLPPFFSSPLRDGGYDVADYTNVLPEFGTIEDTRALIAAVHGRGMRIIIDFVMNHTSSAHPWFQASRTDPTGPYGDFYVWRDKPDEYLDARIIFIDTIDSNWSFDEVRGQYYWHRFFDHQPDLNFENPRVFEEIQNALRFWLDMGVDGFRLDAVPYLIEQDGTDCENLPGTHALLKRVRAMVEEEYPGRILLCEANQWPQEVIPYFGDGDECQLAFHFPVMPRMYMALAREDKTCLVDIIAATPPLPPGTQWGTFLRNHDELTLEMVTPEERDFMWDFYAPEPRMKCNLGIRRRLAPLVDGDVQRIKLLHALLLALPGSPVLYYGDEIGMGDNIWLQDRDGVRTPMQWDNSPGAGFSTADPSTFPFPIVDSPGFTQDVVNVEAQLDDPDSLLHWLQRTLSVRRELEALALGDFVDLEGDNAAVYVVARQWGDQRVIAAFNFSASAQTATLTPGAFDPEGVHVLVGGAAFGDHEGRPTLTLASHGFAWLVAR